LAVVNVVQGKRYRFRLISISCDPSYTFSIDGHRLTIIEADGENTKPLTVDGLHIFTGKVFAMVSKMRVASLTAFLGQRYSVVVTANQTVDNYWIRALPLNSQGQLPRGFPGGVNSAILRYKGAPTAEPTSRTVNGTLLLEANLHPLDDKTAKAPGRPLPGGADININLDITSDPIKQVFFINGKQFITPAVPVLLQILSGARFVQDLLPQGSIYSLPRNKVVEVTIPGGSPGGDVRGGNQVPYELKC
jgi:iron transport multicopper oxidase